MVNITSLKETIKDSGITITALARKTGILRATLYNKLSGRGEFTASEIENISNALHLNGERRDSIFFAKEVELQ